MASCKQPRRVCPLCFLTLLLMSAPQSTVSAQYEELVAAIVKAVPEIKTGELCYPCDGLGMDNGEQCGFCKGSGGHPFIRAITLANCVEALKGLLDGFLVHHAGELAVEGDCKTDDLAKQSAIVHRFLHKRLCR